MAVPGWALLPLLVPVCLSQAAFASDIEKARSLLEEGKATIKKARAAGGDAIHGSHEAIEKLQEAARLLEDSPAGSRKAELLQDINSLIFWTRRTTPLDVRSLIARSGGPPSSPSEAPKSPSDPAGAAAALARAEGYARSHPDDHLTCAARFFEIADRYKDVHDVAFRAISRAQELQRLAEEREALRKAEANFAELPRDEQLAVEGDRAYAEKNFQKAALRYGQAIDAGKTASRHRKLGHALFGRAQVLRAEYTEAYLEGLGNYKRARRRRDARGMKRARDEAVRAGRISKEAILHYERAEAAFRAAWVASDRVDLDSELHMALTFIIRKETRYVKRARSILERILLDYHGRLATDEERTLYACAETYAGPASVSRARWKIARRGTQPPTDGDEHGSETTIGVNLRSSAAATGLPPREMSDDALKKALAEAEAGLRKLEHRLRAYQATGRFDKRLLDEVNAGRERVKELVREAERRGVR